MIATTLAMYLALYLFLILSYVRVLFYLAEKPALPTPEAEPKGKLISASAAARA
jgi:hypothetical protein